MRRHRTSFCLIVALALTAATPLSAQTPPLATAVKATYLYKLAPFVEWPAGDATRPFNICVVGPDPFGPLLDQAVAGQTNGGRPFTIVRMAVLDAPAACEVVYAADHRSKWPRRCARRRGIRS